MGKAEIGTAKYQAKKLKAAGLQKLKFYCQICEKQCRDYNGFKNHLSSPSHLGRISNIESSGKTKQIVEEYSSHFRSEFLNLLRISHGTKKINANRFYQEVIINKDHIHMNSTKWRTLTSFVKYLGKSGYVKVYDAGSDDEFNLEISYIDRSKFMDEKQKEMDVQSKEDVDITEKLLDRQIKKGNEKADVKEDNAPILPAAKGPIKLNIKKKQVKKLKNALEDE
ncbi:unnamed protein product [Candida verbasci]|uniref:C2H2-type domain-containing protein n=1 Tax=Candida verbasci TaxID=1227364 RepID=A0A9W4TUJ3_9ASCO|nr:unnamed protein product [Candida verbasci]